MPGLEPGVKTDGVKTVLFNVRVSLQELEGWRAAAAGEGVSVSEWVRRRCAGSFAVVAGECSDGSRVVSVPDGAPMELSVSRPSGVASVLERRFGS